MCALPLPCSQLAPVLLAGVWVLLARDCVGVPGRNRLVARSGCQVIGAGFEGGEGFGQGLNASQDFPPGDDMKKGGRRALGVDNHRFVRRFSRDAWMGAKSRGARGGDGYG